jgi:hypothetical protein
MLSSLEAYILVVVLVTELMLMCVTKIMNAYICRRATELDYEVRHVSLTGDKFHVNLQRWSCDCRKWLLTGLPCCHAISCMKKFDMNIFDFVPDIFMKENMQHITVVQFIQLMVKVYGKGLSILIFSHHPSKSNLVDQKREETRMPMNCWTTVR